VNIKRNRTPSEYICYGLHLYFSGLSLRRTSERLSSGFIKRNHVSIWNWIQKYNPKKITAKRKKIEEFIVDETLIELVQNSSGFGLLSSLRTNKSLD
jgi:putative transposase